MSVKVQIEGDGLNFSAETSVSKAARIIAFIDSSDHSQPQEGGLVRTTVTPPPHSGAFALEGTKKRSFREALMEANASSNPQKITVLGREISKGNDQETFSIKEIQEAFRRAGESLPRNLSRDIVNTVNVGLIEPLPGSRGEYYVTNRGITQIESQFANLLDGIRRPSSPKTKRSAARLGINDQVKELLIEPELDGLPSYWKADNKSLRIVWILEYCKRNRIQELSATDIDSLAKRLGDEIKSNSVFSKAQLLIKKGYISRNPSGCFRILKGGTDMLAELMTEEHPIEPANTN